MKLNKDKIIQVLKFVWIIAVVIGGVYYVIKNYAQAIQYLNTISPLKLVASVVLILIARLLNTDLVQRSLELVGWKPNFKEAFNLVSISQLGKYIPGGVWQFVARFAAYKDNNISVKHMGVSFLVENLWMVLGSLFVSLFFLGISAPVTILDQFGIHLTSHLLQVIAIISLGLFIVSLIIIEFAVKTEFHQPKIKNVLPQLISQLMLWVTMGLSFFVLFSKIGSLNDLFFTIGAFGISFLAGYVAIFAPGGIGIREYVAVVLFSILFSSSVIGIYTIMHRLLYTVVEFLLGGIAYLLSRKKNQPQKSEEVN